MKIFLLKMTRFKAISGRMSTVSLWLFWMLLFCNPLKVKAQDTIAVSPEYFITADTIISFDTILKIDTIIRPKLVVRIDTVMLNAAVDSAADMKRPMTSDFSGSVGLTVNQLAITHWAAGGESNASGKITADFKYSLNKKKFNYVTTGLLSYGLSSYAKNKRVEKTEDRCEISMTMSNNNNKNVTFTSMATLKTQFSNGYAYPNDSVPISDFFAPGYLTLSVGYTYTLFNKSLSIFVSPVSGKMTFVMNQTLADQGAFGVEAGYWNIVEGDSTWVPGKNFLSEIGINILVKYAKEFTPNIKMFTTLNCHNNYLDQNRSNRWNIDIDWETGLTMFISKRISTILNVHLMYDDNVKFSVTEIEDGIEVTKQRPLIQFKESLGITILYKFAT